MLGKAPVLALALALTACGSDEETPENTPQPLTVMTFNVLCSFCGAGEYDPWQERLAYFEDIFARHDADLIGLQELTPIAGEVDAVLGRAPGYAALYYNQDEGVPYPDATIFYRQSRFDLVERGEYWLSPTPDVPSSTGFADSQLPRLLVWARLYDKINQRERYFASTHFDNNSPSQELSAPLVKERTAPYIAQEPVIVVGDFNSKPDSVAFQTLTSFLTDSYALSAEHQVVHNQDPAPSYDDTTRIDHIFVAGDGVSWTVETWAADLTVYGPNQRYPSDHVPIVARMID